MDGTDTANAEMNRLREDAQRVKNWKRWGSYLAERQWGTVREDYSADGSCWEYFPHDQARSRTYRWGEDGILGLTDRECRLCFALALWNGQDPILKERMFGLTNHEGNHGEDVKEALLLPRCDAHPFLHARPVSIPAEGISLQAARRGEQAPGPGPAGIRDCGYGRVQRRPILRHLRRVCQGLRQ